MLFPVTFSFAILYFTSAPLQNLFIFTFDAYLYV